MLPNQADQSTGYPPVKPVEQEQAQSTAQSDRKSSDTRGRPTGLTNDQRIIRDVMAAVIEKHRTEISSAPVAPETRQYALDRIDAILLEILQAVLGGSPTLDPLFVQRSASS
jgi:hypothetical protein